MLLAIYAFTRDLDWLGRLLFHPSANGPAAEPAPPLAALGRWLVLQLAAAQGPALC